MKASVICPVLLCGICFFPLFSVTSGQYFNNPNITYKADFEYLHRGTFNMSYCSRELINCWELISPMEMICNYGTTYESVCGLMRNFCYDNDGDNDTYYRFMFHLQEQACDPGANYYDFPDTFRPTRRVPRRMWRPYFVNFYHHQSFKPSTKI